MKEQPMDPAQSSESQPDSLRAFLANATHNERATIANLPDFYRTLATVDHSYAALIKELGKSPEIVAGFFLFRSHCAFRGAARLALCGQIAESYMVLRGCLESSLYGLNVCGNLGRQEAWLHRHQDEKSLALAKSEFQVRKVFDHLASVDKALSDVAKRLYDQTIDYGGHPNERSVTTQIDIRSTASHHNVTAEYLLCGDVPHIVSLKSVLRVGVWSLEVFSHAFRDLYRDLQIDQMLIEIRNSF